MNSLFEEKKYLFAWHMTKGIGMQQLIKIRDRYRSFKIAWDSLPAKHNDFDVDKQWQELLKSNPEVISWLDKQYPDNLLNSYPEPFLYYRGNLSLLQSPKIMSIVGSRKLDNYNARALRFIFEELKNSALTIVSGLAYGIDALAHELALENNLPCIAVPGSPVNDQELYPQPNLGLAKNILKHNGLIISPFPAGTLIDKYTFPRRNMTIAGLSQATLIASAATRSGALITAKLALDTNRDVLAIPGNIDQLLCQGTNQIIKEGAQVITCGQDILKIMNIPIISTDSLDCYQLASKEEKIIIDLLKVEPMTMDSLLKKNILPGQLLMATVSQMELKGWLKKTAGNSIHLK